MSRRRTPPPQPWIPIRRLEPRHRHRLTTHLLALSPQDRYRRFGHVASDAQICRHVAQLDFRRDELFGVFDARLRLIATAHLACPPADLSHDIGAEFGVSVLPDARGLGLGRRLFDHAALHARNRGLGRLYIHALAENTAMLAIARAAGATITRSGPEADAWIELPPETVASQVEQWLEHGAAELDYGLKRQMRRLSGWWRRQPSGARAEDESAN